MKCPTKTRQPLAYCTLRFSALIGVAILMLIVTGSRHPVRANRNLPVDLSYSTETTWLLPGLPDLDATSGYIPHNFSHGEAIFQIGSETIHGFRPGKAYPEMYIRDIAWGMETAQYYYPDEYLREPIEAYLRRQYTAETISLDGDFGVVAGAGAIGGILTPDGRRNKQTATTDEETSLIHAAYLYYAMTYNSTWLQTPINGLTVIQRLNLAADWLYRYRLDPQRQLLWRGHTTDWGDVKFERGPGYTDYNPAQDHRTVSIYDQALATMALLELAEMNASVGDTERADVWQEKAEALKKQTNDLLWQPDKGFYLTHDHVTPLTHDFDESAMVSISNALAVYAGLTTDDQTAAIFKNLEAARLAAGVNKPGLSLYPFYPNKWPDLFFEYSGMGYGNYQNGGVWDWWGGVQIKAEFLRGFSEAGRNHLFQVANDWQEHPGNIIEWQSSTDPRHEGSHYYSAAAGTMGSAIIEGFFGITLTGNGLTIQPRLGLNDGYIRVYQAATDRYAAYTYDWNQDVTQLNYGTNTEEVVKFKLLKLRSEQISQITIDGKPVDFSSETVGLDTYTVFNAPSGQHAIEIIKGRTGVQPAALSVSTSPEVEAPPATDNTTPTPSIAPNVAAPVQPESANPDTSDEAIAAYDSEMAAQLAAVSLSREQHRRDLQMTAMQVASGILVLIACLTLMFLGVVRRLVGMNATKSLPKRSSKRR
ncbi:MAG: hypothetical protein KDJ52_05285 [Anaerolineae bacterium]|nr:hypothetical protein [Anaerolineae bacterium]